MATLLQCRRGKKEQQDKNNTTDEDLRMEAMQKASPPLSWFAISICLGYKIQACPSPLLQSLLHSEQGVGMHIGGLQKMTLLDYPGMVACTVFLDGCNFRCPFCHNPDLVVAPKPEPVVSEREFFAFLSQREGFLDGVCITGGEPMLNRELVPFIKGIRDRGFLVKLDTNGSFPDRLQHLVTSRLVDYVAMDIKNSKEHYGTTIGLPSYDTKGVERSVAILMEGDVPYEFRTTLVREFHTGEDMHAIGEWLKGCRALYLQSFLDSGNLLGNEVMTAFSAGEMDSYKNLLKRYIEPVYIRGL